MKEKMTIKFETDIETAAMIKIFGELNNLTQNETMNFICKKWVEEIKILKKIMEEKK